MQNASESTKAPIAAMQKYLHKAALYDSTEALTNNSAIELKNWILTQSIAKFTIEFNFMAFFIFAASLLLCKPKLLTEKVYAKRGSPIPASGWVPAHAYYNGRTVPKTGFFVVDNKEDARKP